MTISETRTGWLVLAAFLFVTGAAFFAATRSVVFAIGGSVPVMSLASLAVYFLEPLLLASRSRMMYVGAYVFVWSTSAFILYLTWRMATAPS